MRIGEVKVSEFSKGRWIHFQVHDNLVSARGCVYLTMQLLCVNDYPAFWFTRSVHNTRPRLKLKRWRFWTWWWNSVDRTELEDAWNRWSPFCQKCQEHDIEFSIEIRFRNRTATVVWDSGGRSRDSREELKQALVDAIKECVGGSQPAPS